jgi:hypothetical protein
MAYMKDKPNPPNTAALRANIKGWGADLDPATRPAVPRENYNPGGTGAHWDFPERQIATFPREKSTEHRDVTPVFGTSCPPKGLSGVLRRAAYKYWSEGQTIHWLTLVFADRVDVLESMVVDMFRGKPDNMLAEWGVRSELRPGGFLSRFGQHRADTKRTPLDIMTMGATLFLVGATGFAAVNAIKKAVAPPKKRSLFA